MKAGRQEKIVIKRLPHTCADSNPVSSQARYHYVHVVEEKLRLGKTT